MPYVQRNLPAPVKPYSFTFNNFTGGLNNAVSDELLQINEASDILNMSVNEEGTLQKRNGVVKLEDFNYGSSIEFIDIFRSKDGDRLIVCTDTELYLDKTKIADVSNPISGLSFNNRYFYADETGIYVFGTYPQANSGDYTKVIGTPTTDEIVMQITTPGTYTPLDASHNIGTTIYDYNSKTIKYQPCKNELDDTYKGNNVVPAIPSILTQHGGRIYSNGDDVNFGNVFATDIMNPFYFPVGLPMQLPPNGKKITALKVFMDSVVVSRADEMYVIYGNTNRTNLGDLFIVKKLNVHTGIMNNNCAVSAHNYLFYLGSDGVVYGMRTTQTDVQQLMTQEISKQLNLFAYPISHTPVTLSECYALFFDDKFYLVHPDKTLVYSYRFRAWSLYKGVPATCAIYHNELRLIADNDGNMYKAVDSYDDDGMPYPAYWASKRYDFGVASNYKQFKEIYVVAHVFPNYISDVRVRYEIDYTDVIQTASIINQMSIWGKWSWGDRFINRNISPSLPINIGRRGRKLRIIIANGESITESFANKSAMETQTHPVLNLLYYVEDEKKFYRYTLDGYTETGTEYLFQPMKVYEINGEYKMRGKR